MSKNKKIDQLKLDIDKNRENEDSVQLEVNLKYWRKLQKTSTKLEYIIMAELEMYKNNFDKASEHLVEALRKDKFDQEIIMLYGVCTFKKSNQVEETSKILQAVEKIDLEKLNSKREALLCLNVLSLKGACLEASNKFKEAEEIYLQSWKLFLEIFKKFELLSQKKIVLNNKIHENYFQFTLFGLARINFEQKNQIAESVQWWRKSIVLPLAEISSKFLQRALKNLASLLLFFVCDEHYVSPNLTELLDSLFKDEPSNLIQFSPKKKNEEIILLFQLYLNLQETENEKKTLFSSSHQNNTSLDSLFSKLYKENYLNENDFPFLEEQPVKKGEHHNEKTEIEEETNQKSLIEEKKESKEDFEKRAASDDVFDGLALAFGNLNAFGSLRVFYEKAIFNNFEDDHLWKQFVFSLICEHQYERAFFVLKQLLSKNKSDVFLLMLASKLCVNHLAKFKEAVHFCERGLKMVEKGESISLPGESSAMKQLYHTMGIAYSNLAFTFTSFEERKKSQKESLKYLEMAYHLDKNDSLLLFHIALQYALSRDIEQSILFVKSSLQLNQSSSLTDLWHLFVLLLSSQKKWEQSLQLCNVVLQQYPNNIDLLLTKLRLQLFLDDKKNIPNTLSLLFKNWKAFENLINQKFSLLSLEEETNFPQNPQNKVEQEKQIPPTSPLQQQQNDQNSILINSLLNTKPNAPEWKRQFSNYREVFVGESVDTFAQTCIWLNVAEIFIEQENWKEASECIKEAQLIDPFSSDVLFVEAYYKEKFYIRDSSFFHIVQNENLFLEIQNQYEKVLTINSHHIEAKLRLGLLFLQKKNYLLAENYFTSIIREDPTQHQAWFNLGLVLKQKSSSELERASECFITSLHLEQTSPIRPFSIFIPQI